MCAQSSNCAEKNIGIDIAPREANVAIINYDEKYAACPLKKPHCTRQTALRQSDAGAHSNEVTLAELNSAA